MQRLLPILCALVAATTVWAASQNSKPSAHPLLKSESVVWAGLDYSMVRMYGTQDFKDPEVIFPGMFENWNALFLQELVLHPSQRLQKATDKSVVSDLEGVGARNKLAKPDQIIREDGAFCGQTHIGEGEIAEAVRSLQMKNTNGLGLVFIVDRLVKVEQKGAVHLVYFDVATRDVIAKERVIVKAAGFGFRNYWFRVVKDALPSIKKLR